MEPRSTDTFTRWAHLYDAIYARKGKDYHAECRELISIVDEVSVRPTQSPPSCHWIDLACGTGEHLAHLSQLRDHDHFVGLDRNPAMLAVARRKVSRASWVLGDLRRLPLEASQVWGGFQTVTCLFASIGYLPSREDVRGSIHEMARLLVPGGALFIEPPVSRERLLPPERSSLTLDVDGWELRRSTSATVRGDVLEVRFDLAVGNRSWTEVHPILLLPEAFIGACLEEAGLEVCYRPGSGGRLELYAARRPGARGGRSK